MVTNRKVYKVQILETNMNKIMPYLIGVGLIGLSYFGADYLISNKSETAYQKGKQETISTLKEVAGITLTNCEADIDIHRKGGPNRNDDIVRQACDKKNELTWIIEQVENKTRSKSNN